MQFAWYSHFSCPETADPSRVLAELTEEIQYAEALGFVSAWVAEHHFSHYGMLSAPAVLLSNVAAKTKTIRLGTAVLVAPLHNPIRLAEDLAMLDRVSDGRVIIGFGRGNGAYEYMGYRVDPAESQVRFREAITIVKGLFTTPEFSFSGQYFTVEKVTLVPTPVQKPHPPIFIAASRTPATLEFVAATGHPTLAGFAMDTVDALDLCNRYVKQSAVAGINLPISSIPFFRHLYVADTEDQAREDTRASMDLMQDMNQFRGTFTVGSDASHSLAEWRKTRVKTTPTYEQIWERRAFFGTPATVIPRIRAIQQQGFETFGCNFQFGGMDHAKVMQSMELFAKEVMPEFQ